jgi:hypothetical protein
MANTQRGNPIFAVRLPAETQAAIRGAAKQNGLGVAEWVANAVRMALDPAGTRIPQDAPGIASGAVDRQTYQSDLDALTARIEALEAAMVKRPKATIKPKAEVATVTDAPAEKLVSAKAGRKLSDEQVEQIRVMRGEGLGARAIAVKLGIHRGTVYSYLKKPGLEG